MKKGEGSHGGKIEQEPSAIHVLFSMLNKFLHKLSPTQNIHAQPKMEENEKLNAPQNCQTLTPP